MELSGSCVKDVQFTPDMPDMKIRTWFLETIPFELFALVQFRTSKIELIAQSRSFLHQECCSLLTSCYSHISHKADVGISRPASNARTAGPYRADGKRPEGSGTFRHEPFGRLMPFLPNPILRIPLCRKHGTFCRTFFGKVGIEVRQSGKGSCLYLQKQTFKAIKWFNV